MTTATYIDWAEIESLANKLQTPGTDPGSFPESEWMTLSRTLDILVEQQDWKGVMRLRLILIDLFSRDTVAGLDIIRRLDEEAIRAAELMGDKMELASLLGARGHNLHRQGFHLEAIAAFEKSIALYRILGESFAALKNYFMLALCYRALGDRTKAYTIVHEVLDEVDDDNPWRGQPIQVLAWLARDERRYSDAENHLRVALDLHRKTDNSDILVAGAFADLGEILGFQGKIDESESAFHDSLALLYKHKGQYDRQEARTKVKFAEMLVQQRGYDQAMHLLNESDDLIRGYGHYYDQLWKIELVKANILLRQGRLLMAFRKYRAVMHYRKILGLPIPGLVRKVFGRAQKRQSTLAGKHQEVKS